MNCRSIGFGTGGVHFSDFYSTLENRLRVYGALEFLLNSLNNVDLSLYVSASCC
jgi:hypothetical protein